MSYEECFFLFFSKNVSPYCSCDMIDLKELCLVSGKAAWMGYLVSTPPSIIVL